MNRRDFLKKMANSALTLSLAGAAGLGVSVANDRDVSTLIERKLYNMGTHGKIIVAAESQNHAERALNAATDRIQYLEEKLTKFSSYSDIGRLNRHPNTPLYLSQDTIDILKIGMKLTPRTYHRFDMGMGNLLAKEGLDSSVDRVGNSDLSEGSLKRSKLIEINGRLATLIRKNTMLDLGGIGKGYALQEGLKVILAHGIKHAAIDLGGDLIVHGGKAPGKPWSIAIDPNAHASNSGKTFHLISGAIASSGDYYKPNHIIDPITLKPIHRYQLATIVGPNATTCDVLATAAFNSSEKHIKLLRNNFPKYQFYVA